MKDLPVTRAAQVLVIAAVWGQLDPLLVVKELRRVAKQLRRRAVALSSGDSLGTAPPRRITTMSHRSNEGELPPELFQQVRARLSAVCSSIPEPELTGLVEEVVRVKLECDRRLGAKRGKAADSPRH